ncbi:MAG: T9SS type A sorting domain-containing protein [Bacteroidia bacterium]
MKKLIVTCLFLFMGSIIVCNAQIENLIVETYYISDSLDATDSTNYFEDPSYSIPFLPTGSKTYRVYLDLKEGSRLLEIYGDTNHLLKIASTADFFNNIRYPNDYFGYKIQKDKFDSYPTLALDSWLTLGLAAKYSTINNYSGILKSADPDSSFTEIVSNDGGTAGIPGGILKNNDPLAGIPLTSADGYVLYNDTNSWMWSDYGFRNGNYDTTVFGSTNAGSVFISDDTYLLQNTGVAGPTPENIVLVAQLTTLGELMFELNVAIEKADGTIVHYVADDSILVNTTFPIHIEQLSPYLKYPPVCGCTDADYLEYSNEYACPDPAACITRIVFGCTDPLACNYDPSVNFNIPSLCCYPGSCGDRDIAVVCPSLNNTRLMLFPNPVKDQLTLQFTGVEQGEAKYSVYNSYGQVVIEKNAGMVSEIFSENINTAGLRTGLYLVRLFVNDASYSKIFLKN